MKPVRLLVVDDHNLFRRYSTTITQFSEFDPDSIMLYAFPKSIILSGPVSSTKLNHELSELDRRTIASLGSGRSGSPCHSPTWT